MLRVRVLGGIDITRDTLPVELPARQKAVALLVMLLTAPEGRIERRQAAAALFAGSPPDRALANLRLQVFHLQQALAAGGAAPWLDAGRDALVWRRDGATWIDVDAFNDAAGRVLDARLDATDVDAARRALALYRGELAPGVYLPAIDSARDALAARHRAVSLTLGRHLATQGAWHEAHRIAAALVGDDPLDDDAQQLLVRSLVGRGDPSAAAAALDRYTAQIDPRGTASDAVPWRAAALAGDGRGVGPSAADPSTPGRRSGAKATVRAPRSALVGRGNERRALADMLRHQSIVTLIGPGGTGKTRLATEVAAELSAALADHAWFVDLGAVERPGQVLAQVALALGVGHVPGQAPDNGIRTRLQGLRGLVVLDNCEHVIESAAAAARLLAESGEGIRVLATSRRPLGLDGELVWRLGPLSLPPDPGRRTATWHDLEAYDAPQLFVVRAGLVRDEATATEQATAVVAICRQLDGLPLAIELVAAQCRVLSLGELAADVDLLAHSVNDGQRWRPSRHRTLRSTIAWSYNLLEPDERALLRRLAVFSGGFTRAAAAAVVGAGGGGRKADGAAVGTMLQRLVDQSLLAMSPDAGAAPRFHLLHTIRHFAARRLEQDDRAARWQRRHALYFERVAVRAEEAFLGRDEALWLDRLRRDHTNLVAAIQWSAAHGQPELAMRIAAHLWRHWYGAGHVPQATAMVTALADDLPPTAPAHLRHMAHFALGQLAFAQGSYERADESLRSAVAGFASEGDERHQALGLTFLCRTAINRADFDAAAEHGRTALALLAAHDDPHAVAIVQLALADGSVRQMRLDEAVVLYRACLGTWRALRYASGAASAHLGLGMARLRQADYRRARAHFERSLALRHRAKEEIGIAAAEALIAAVDAAVGDLGAARVGFAASLERYRSHGNIAGVASCLHNLGDVAWRSGELGAADQHYQQALMLPYVSEPMRAWLSYARAEVRLAQGDEIGAAELIGAARSLASTHALQDLVADTLRLEARLAFDRGDVAIAHRMLAESLGIWRGQGALEGALRALDTWLACAPAGVSPAAAIELQAAIDHWRERKACPRSAVEQRGVDARIAAALAVVGPHAAASARRRGRRWPMESLWEVSDRVGAADHGDAGPRQHRDGGHG